MNYLKTFEKYKHDRVNEEFLGNLLKNIGKKISLNFSKKFGSASKVDKIIQQYVSEVNTLHETKNISLKALTEYIKGIKNGGDKDQNKLIELNKNFRKADELYKKQLVLIKQKFDIKINAIVEGEENKKIVNYIKIKKLEMEQDLITNELKIVQNDAGITDDMIKELPEFQKYLKNIQARYKETTGIVKQESDIINTDGGSDIEDGFSFEKARIDKNYNNKKSKFYSEYKFVADEKIKYWSNDNFVKQGSDYDGTIAYIGPDDKQNDLAEGNIYVTREVGKSGYAISRGKIISSEKDKEVKDDKEEKEE